MTKFSLVSDLHLDTYNSLNLINLIEMYKQSDADVHLIAGDISNSVDSTLLIMKHIEDNIPKPFIYNFGNHGFYGDTLFNDSIKWTSVDGVCVASCTLWTSFRNGDYDVLKSFEQMWDPQKIKPALGDKTIQESIIRIHQEQLEWLEMANPHVILTHHAPTKLSIHPRYIDSIFMNHCFVNSFEERELSRFNRCQFWGFGHVHHRHTYNIGKTQFVCNPLGYPGENSGQTFSLYEFEVKI